MSAMTDEEAIEYLLARTVNTGSFVPSPEFLLKKIAAIDHAINAIDTLALIKRALGKVEYVAELNSFASAMWDWHTEGDTSALKRLAGG